MIKNVYFIPLLLAIAGCASQDVTKAVGLNPGDTICVVPNPDVREDFLDAYLLSLEKHGFEAFNANVSDSACSVTSEYTARYGMHWGVYLATADLKILKNGELIGRAEYRAPRSDPSKHGRVQAKIDNLVNAMLSQ